MTKQVIAALRAELAAIKLDPSGRFPYGSLTALAKKYGCKRTAVQHHGKIVRKGKANG